MYCYVRRMLPLHALFGILYVRGCIYDLMYCNMVLDSKGNYMVNYFQMTSCIGFFMWIHQLLFSDIILEGIASIQNENEKVYLAIDIEHNVVCIRS